MNGSMFWLSFDHSLLIHNVYHGTQLMLYCTVSVYTKQCPILQIVTIDPSIALLPCNESHFLHADAYYFICIFTGLFSDIP